jgi:hypothetical protein
MNKVKQKFIIGTVTRKDAAYALNEYVRCYTDGRAFKPKRIKAEDKRLTNKAMNHFAKLYGKWLNAW